MRIVFATLAIAAAAATLAVPAFAKTAEIGDNDQVVLTKNNQGMYCASYMVTGSRLPQMVCKTRQDWVALGGRIQAAR